MPIYAYQCQQCGHELDAIQKISDAPLKECPACHELELKKMLTAPSFRLSGSGWYETDFKKDNKKNLAGEQKPDSTAASGSSESTSGEAAGGTAGGDKSSAKSSSSSAASTADAG